MMHDVVATEKFPPRLPNERHPIQASLPKNKTGPLYYVFPVYEAPSQPQIEFERHR